MSFPRATRAALASRCRELGARLIVEERVCVRVDAPRRHTFAGPGVHYLDIYLNPAYPIGEAYAELLADLEMGLVACEDAECDCCQPAAMTDAEWREHDAHHYGHAEIVVPYGLTST